MEAVNPIDANRNVLVSRVSETTFRTMPNLFLVRLYTNCFTAGVKERSIVPVQNG